MTGRRAWWAAVAFLWAAWAWAGAPTEAAAQTFQILNPSQLKRRVGFREQAQDPTTIYTVSLDDCLAYGDQKEGETGDEFYFQGTQTGLNGYSFEVWASQTDDCTVASNRQSTLNVCWKVKTLTQFPEQTFEIPIRVQDVIHGKVSFARDSENRGVPEDCATHATGSNAAQTSDNAVTYTLYFVVASGAANVANAPTDSYTMKVDTRGPAGLSLKSVSSGESTVNFSWNLVTNVGVSGYNFFCEPVADADYEQACGAGAQGTSGASGASGASGSTSSRGDQGASGGGAGGASGDGGVAGRGASGDGSGGANGDARSSGRASRQTAGAGGASGASGDGGAAGDAGASGDAGAAGDGGTSTFTSVLVPGELPPPDASLVCGSLVSGADSEYTVKNVANYGYYRVGMAAVDLVGNPGVLSDVQCVQPMPVDDFYRLYRAAGGEAGGGYCSVKAPGRAWGAFASFAALGAVALAFALRRRPS